MVGWKTSKAWAYLTVTQSYRKSTNLTVYFCHHGNYRGVSGGQEKSASGDLHIVSQPPTTTQPWSQKSLVYGIPLFWTGRPGRMGGGSYTQVWCNRLELCCVISHKKGGFGASGTDSGSGSGCLFGVHPFTPGTRGVDIAGERWLSPPGPCVTGVTL